ncbi:DUF177 domain-containing protein [Patescibacteria group bacterium]|nr:DUF177 domain-containing protein [Patescibacteria group bacterium]
MHKWPIKISSLFNAPLGGKSSLKLSQDIDIFEEDFGVKGLAQIKGDLDMFKMEESVAAIFRIAPIKLDVSCCKCLNEFPVEIEFPEFERVFLLSKPKSYEKNDDSIMADLKNCEIDVAQPIYQEILLHLSPNPVCLTGCKGLCSKCGQNLNDSTCKCSKIVNPENPFSTLKNLF